MDNNIELKLYQLLTTEKALAHLRSVSADDPSAIFIAAASYLESTVPERLDEAWLEPLAEIAPKIRQMTDKDVMEFRLVNRLIERPEILDDLRERIENEEIVEWEDNPRNQ